ncbi:MAG: phosphoadenylyl-sulfate reductase [Actinobacteria bacterium]|nr:phosphoadenylyl-sulfate reductase [Actinomycetota bacterium]
MRPSSVSPSAPLEEPVTETPLTLRPSQIELDEIEARAREFETSPPGAIVRWAAERFGDGLVLAASFQDCLLIDIAVREVPDIEVIFLDTQYHFAETLWYVEQVKDRYQLNLTVVEPLVDPDNRWQHDLDGCCGVRKVEPLNRALAGRSAWMSGLRRADGPSRADTPVVFWDEQRGLVKVNPVATWTDEDVEGYSRDHDLLVHPLTLKGYPSIGCWPCTSPVAPGEDPRSGRWKGSDKTECGINL